MISKWHSALLLAAAVTLGLGLFWLLEDPLARRVPERGGARDPTVHAVPPDELHNEPGRDEPLESASGSTPGARARLLSGHVMHEGSPVQGAQLHVVAQETYAATEEELARWSTPTRSMDDGAFQLPVLLDSPFVLICRKATYQPAAMALQAVPDDSVTVELTRGESVTGRVVSRSGSVIMGATVHARALAVPHAIATAGEAVWPGPSTLHFGEAETDSAGRFEISGLDSRRSYIVEAYAVGYALQDTSIVSAQRWVQPPADVGDLVLVRTLVGVVGLRRGAVDFTRTVDAGLYRGLSRIVPPEGFELAFSSIPNDRFPNKITERLIELNNDGGVYLYHPVDATVRTTPAPKLSIELLRANVPIAAVHVELHPIGSPGWDRRQWRELPADGGAPAGTVEIEAPGWDELLLLSSGVTGLFSASLDTDSGVHRVHLPPGTYTVRRMGASLYGDEWSVTVGSGQVAKLTLPSPRGVLTIDPRTPDGTPLREVGIRIRKDSEILFRELDPLGCSSGPLQLPIEGAMCGEVEIWVTKTQYEGHRVKMTLEAGDVHWRPTLRPLRAE